MSILVKNYLIPVRAAILFCYDTYHLVLQKMKLFSINCEDHEKCSSRTSYQSYFNSSCNRELGAYFEQKNIQKKRYRRS